MSNNGTATVPLRLPLPRPALARLKELSIYCETGVTLELRRDKQPVLRAVESGGAAAEIGHYVLFCEGGAGVPAWLQLVQSVAANGRHAVIMSSAALVSVEMFRFRQTYQLLIVEHSIKCGEKPSLQRRQLFAGRDGALPLDLCGTDGAAKGSITPEFFTRGGERRELPSALVDAVKVLTAAVNTVNVSKPLFAKAPEPTS